MKVYLPLMVQDPLIAKYPGVERVVEGMHLYLKDGGLISDGPSLPWLRVLDRNIQSGEETPAAIYEPPTARRKMGRFRLAKPYDIYSPTFIQVAAFAAAAKTIREIDAPNVLGHPTTWYDRDAPLTILPRAGKLANALYERQSQSLQFFSFADPHHAGQLIHTALSREVVAHECAHAIIDGIAPHLYDSSTPQALAVSETLADLFALLTTLTSGSLTKRVLEDRRGDIRDSSAFSYIASEIGAALSTTGHANALRNLWNDRKLNPAGVGQPTGAHELSEILSGSLYALLVSLYTYQFQTQERYTEEEPRADRKDYSDSGYFLALVARVFHRWIVRVVDLLPPGDCSFAEFCRCMLWVMARDLYARVDRERARTWAVSEFSSRGLLKPESSRVDARPIDGERLPRGALTRILEEDGYALEFALTKYGEIFGDPPPGDDAREVRKNASHISLYEGGTVKHLDEVVVKVSWIVTEPLRPSVLGFDRRSTRRGVSVIIDERRGRTIGVLRAGFDDLRAERDSLVETLHVRGLLTGPNSSRHRGEVLAEDVGGALTLYGAGAMLHRGI
jgi:hypothetical protein